jgi:rare lipoprotein A
MRDQVGLSTRVLFPPIFLVLSIFSSPSPAQPIAVAHLPPAILQAGEVIVGIASFYDEPGPTASGEAYDPNAFTAAALIELRDKFGGIKFGKNYRAAYALAEYGGKRAILKFNDVGPLRPGRKFDLSRAAMEHFGGLEKGLLPDFKIVLLPLGQDYATGPLVDEQPRLATADSEQVEPTDVTNAIDAQPIRTVAAIDMDDANPCEQ